MPGAAGTCTLQFGICSVRDEEGKHHVELGGKCAELNALLSGKPASTDSSSGGDSRGAGHAAAPRAAAILPYIQAMQAACRRLSTAA